MDSARDRLRLKDKIATLGRLNWKPALSVTSSVLLILLALKLFHKIPKPLLLTVSVSFLGCSTVFWSLNRRAQGPVSGRITRLLLVWLSSTALALGLLYYVDRAGWIWFRLTGYDITLAEDLLDRVNLSVTDFISQNQFVSLDPQDPTKLILRKAVYDINETIVIPAGLTLTIEPGTVLRFGVGRSLISYSPIIARGTESQPILFTAQNKWLKWGVVGVVNARKSIFEHVRFDHSRRALVNHIDFLGGLSLIRTDVEIARSEFLNAFGKDAVYVQQAHVFIRHTLFKDAYKDGLDLDSGGGQISHNLFIDCGDEGIDLGGNYDLEVFDNKILDSRGGRIGADQNLDEIKSLNTFGYSGTS
jgi:hypothetical protein